MLNPNELSGHQLFDLTQTVADAEHQHVVRALGAAIIAQAEEELEASIETQLSLSDEERTLLEAMDRENPGTMPDDDPLLRVGLEKASFGRKLTEAIGPLNSYSFGTVMHPGNLTLVRSGSKLLEITTLYADAVDDTVVLNKSHSYCDSTTNKVLHEKPELTAEDIEAVRIAIRRLGEVLPSIRDTED